MRATATMNLGALAFDERRFDDAERLFLDASRLAKEKWPSGHLDSLMNLDNLATLYLEKGDLAKPEPYLKEALDGFRRVLGPDHPSALLALQKLGDLHARREQWRGPSSRSLPRRRGASPRDGSSRRARASSSFGRRRSRTRSPGRRTP